MLHVNDHIPCVQVDPRFPDVLEVETVYHDHYGGDDIREFLLKMQENSVKAVAYVDTLHFQKRLMLQHLNLIEEGPPRQLTCWSLSPVTTN